MQFQGRPGPLVARYLREGKRFGVARSLAGVLYENNLMMTEDSLALVILPIPNKVSLHRWRNCFGLGSAGPLSESLDVVATHSRTLSSTGRLG